MPVPSVEVVAVPLVGGCTDLLCRSGVDYIDASPLCGGGGGTLIRGCTDPLCRSGVDYSVEVVAVPSVGVYRPTM